MVNIGRRTLVNPRCRFTGQEGVEHLHLGPIVLDVADVIERKTLEAVQALELAGEPEVALGIEQALDEACDRGESRSPCSYAAAQRCATRVTAASALAAALPMRPMRS